MSEAGNVELKKRNISFYDSKFGCENITVEISPLDFIYSHFHVKMDQKSSVADLGCGTASLLLSLNCRDRFGLDISRVNLNIAKKRDRNLKLVRADVEYVPLKSESIDVVLIVDLLHHVPTPLNVIKECNRILKFGGCIFIFDACQDGVRPILPLAIVAQRISEKIGSNIENFGPQLSQVKEWLWLNSFKIQKQFGEGTFVRTLESIMSSILKRFGVCPSQIIVKAFDLIDQKFEKILRKYPLKFSVIATKEG